MRQKVAYFYKFTTQISHERCEASLSNNPTKCLGRLPGAPISWVPGALVRPATLTNIITARMQHVSCISCTGERLDDQVLADTGGDLKEARVPAQLLLMDSIFGLSDD